MNELVTERLVLRPFTLEDAAFALELVNEPAFVRFIGDTHVRTLEDARAYLRDGPLASYEKNGFGLLRVETASEGEAVGMCGLLRREALSAPDLGFAFLARAWRRGYAFEASVAVLKWARDVLGLERVLAITAPDNARSARVLQKLHLREEGTVRLAEDGPELVLYGRALRAAQAPAAPASPAAPPRAAAPAAPAPAAERARTKAEPAAPSEPAAPPKPRAKKSKAAPAAKKRKKDPP